MVENLAALPVVGPLFLALALLLWPHPSRPRRVVAGIAFGGLLALAALLLFHAATHGALVLRIGGWVVPFGIVLVVDTLSAIMLTLAAFTALACALYSYADTPTVEEHPLRLPLWFFLIAGINLSFVTGDLFNLFVAFEVMLIASYALLTLEAGAKESRHALPYVLLNLLGSAVFLGACGFTYGLFGTLNFAELIERSGQLAGDARITVLGGLFLVVFGLKAGLFPLYHWLPRAYPTLAAPLAAFYAGMLTKVGVYVLLRVFGTVLPHDQEILHGIIAAIAGITMITGVLGAVAQERVQSILSYHIVSQIGYMVLAIGFFTPFAFAAAIFYIVHHIIVKATLFLVGGAVIRANGTDRLTETGGLWRTAPWLGVVFLLQAFSLAGIPPLSGFWGKLMIVQEGFRLEEWALVVLSLVASVLTLVSMLKIFLAAFWKERPATAARRSPRGLRRMTAVGLGLAATSLAIGLLAEPVLRLARHAANETLDRRGYAANVKSANQTVFTSKTP